MELRTNGEYPGREQPIPVGSYVVVEDKNSLIGGLESFTVQAFIWPTLPGDGYQALLGTWSEETGTGFSIGISPRGCLELCLGRGNNDNTILVTDTVLQTRHWYLVAASYDHITGVASLYQLPYAGHRFHAQKSVRQSGEGIGFAPGPDWFLMGAQHQASARRGAAWRDIVANAHYNGKIECPRLCARVLSEEEIVAIAQVTTATALDGQVVAAWDFGQDMSGICVHDIGPSALNGECVNLPARAMVGHNWSGVSADWRQAVHEYGAIHFHDDDIYDCRWESDFALLLPNDLRSGVYAVKTPSRRV